MGVNPSRISIVSPKVADESQEDSVFFDQTIEDKVLQMLDPDYVSAERNKSDEEASSRGPNRSATKSEPNTIGIKVFRGYALESCEFERLVPNPNDADISSLGPQFENQYLNGVHLVVSRREILKKKIVYICSDLFFFKLCSR